MKSRVGRTALGAVNVFVLGLMLLPVVFVAWSAFYDSTFLTFPPPGYTLRWFSAALGRDAFVSGLMTSVKVAIMAAVAGVIIGTAASLVLQRSRLPGTQLLQTLLISPLMVPNIVLGIALYLFFLSMADKTGFDLSQGMGGLTLAHTLLTLPWSVRLISANLTGLDRSLEEAAMNLGASPVRTFFFVTLPQLRAGMIAAVLFSFIISFENLEISLFLVGPGASTFPIALMQYLEFNMDPTVAAASTLQVVLIATLLVITDRYVKLSRVVA
jgi:putative spermidine/putrescine transport system permease protein